MKWSIFFLIGMECLFQEAYWWRHNDFLWYRPTIQVWSPYSLDDYAPNAKSPGFHSTDSGGFVENGPRGMVKDGEPDIVILGGSTVEGQGVWEGGTISSFLERITDKRVVNAGYRGYTSYQDLARLQGKILSRHHPRVVIDFDGRNDALYASVFKDWRPNWQPGYDLMQARLDRLLNPGPFDSLSAWLLTHCATYKAMSALVYRVRKHDDRVVELDHPASDGVINRALTAWIANHAAAHAICEVQGIKYLAILQPTNLPSLKSISWLELNRLNDMELKLKTPGIYSTGVERFYALASKRIKPYPWIIDMSRLFEHQTKTLYLDSCHYTAEGNKLIAEAIAVALEH